MLQVQARRVYEQPLAPDGTRVLVDRLWPRGLAKDAAHISEWLRAVAPSDELRRWYGHDPARFAEFRRRYGDELRDPQRAQALQHLRELAASGPVTLLTATKDLAHSHAADLAGRLLQPSAGDPATTGDPAPGDPASTGAEPERGGDPACWLHRVCPRCGTLADTDPPTTCPRCHTEISP